MKRITLILVILLALTVSGTYAQNMGNFDELRKLGLTDDEIRKVTEINLATEQEKREAQLELNILKAQLEKLLAGIDPDMRQVEKLLRDSTEWKVKSELAEIKKRVEIRKLIGEEKWRKLLNFLGRRNAAGKDDKTQAQKDNKADNQKSKN
jgi:hypothetical protein